MSYLEGDVPDSRLMATGMLADQAKPVFYRQEILPLRLELLRNEDHARTQPPPRARTQAEEVANKLRNALNTARPTCPATRCRWQAR